MAGRKRTKPNYDEHSILNEAVLSENCSGLEWKSYMATAASAENLDSHRASPEGAEKDAAIAEGEDRENIKEDRETQSGGLVSIENISKKRYEEDLRRKKMDTGKDIVEYLEEAIRLHEAKERNMRATVREKDTLLRVKDQEILLLRQRLSQRPSYELDRRYFRECIEKGKTLAQKLGEEISDERAAFSERLSKELANSRTLEKRIGDLKKILNELVKKIKRSSK
jgi:hypothetical protein